MSQYIQKNDHQVSVVLSVGTNWELLSLSAGEGLSSVSSVAACSASPSQVLLPKGLYEYHICLNIQKINVVNDLPYESILWIHINKNASVFSSQPQSSKLYLQRCCLTFSYLLLPERAGKVCKPEAASRIQQLLQGAAL